jgi:glycosyltransferase involved in cell wall biosynthesis
VTPVYNVEKYIVETIESVKKQSYENWELLLIDDGSTDGSAAICKAYAEKDNRIRYVYKTNGGQATARNQGIKESRGEYITFLDSDDFYTYDKLQCQLDDLNLFKAEFYYGAGYMLFENRKEDKVEKYNWFYGEFSGEYFFKILYHSCAVNINSVFVKKEIFDTVGLFDESPALRGTEDWDLWLRIALNVKKVYGNPEPRVYYRIHNEGIHLQRANMLIGKTEIFGKFDDNKIISSLVRKREYRYTIRELMNNLHEENRENEIKEVFSVYFKKDRFNFVALKQWILIKMLPTNLFLWISNKILYRIGYRLEKITYNLFLND